MTVIEAAHYGENQRALQQDPIIVAMSVEMNAAPDNIKASWSHASGEPTFEFMQIANREFDRRAKAAGGGYVAAESIGAVAKALLANLAILEGKA
ncbi:hypothetical protein SEA_SMEAGAN_90 [Mycobacterium phage Smeagan]|uniref:Uncharacterized protein n=1 Tax=Mycobacterium phage Smeagan TaxID=2829398 RepID=A0A8T8JEE8_9CAUD|nr:hypothetical protein SEA_SMEAGAN_90 [Mycobacterium phage Smeagan]